MISMNLVLLAHLLQSKEPVAKMGSIVTVDNRKSTKQLNFSFCCCCWSISFWIDAFSEFLKLPLPKISSSTSQ